MKKFLLKTKKSSHPSSNNTGSIKKLVIWLIVISALFFGARPIVNSVASFVTTPLFSIRHYVESSGSALPVFIRDREQLLLQIRSLEHKVLEREGAEATLAMVLEENESLRQLLGSSSSTRIAAGIIARPPHTPYDVVLIDKGQIDGIRSQTPVYYGENNLLGFVGKVFQEHALVTLISTPNIETSVYIYGPDIFVTAYGMGGGAIKLVVPQGVIVEEGNIVVAPSIEGGLIGTIERVESKPTEPEQYAYLTYDVPIRALRLVAVGRRPITPSSYEEALESVSEFESTFLRFAFPQEVDSTTTPEQATGTPHIEEIIEP